MSFEYVLNKDDKPLKLKQDEEELVVSDISTKFQSWDNLRSRQIEIYKTLKAEVYLSDRNNKKSDWKSDKKMNKIYSLFQTRQAFLWENIYANIEKMFDVEGKNEISEQNAKYQKAMLVDSFNKMKVSQQLDKGIEFFDTVGEMCLFTSWKKVYKQVKVRDELNPFITTKPQEIYDGAYIEAINPLNLVFDPEVIPEIKEEWDKGGKIIKTFQSLNSIKNNRFYSLKPDQIEELQGISKGDNKDEEEVKSDKDKISEIYNKGKIEVLEYWGDFNFNGKVLENYLITIVARKFLIRFTKNPFVINPIISVATLRDPDSKRGIPCLYSIYDLAKAREEDINEKKDVQALNKNPARFAPDNFFKEEKVEIEPGKIIKYKAGIDDPSAIIPIPVQLISPEQEIAYLDDAISEVSGIYPNMQGNEESGDKTATEIKVKVQGQTTRLAKDLDTIKQNGIVRMVENVADMIMNEKQGSSEQIFMMDKGKKTPATIGDDVRGGAYEYKYSDSNSIATKKAQFKEALELFKLAGTSPMIAGMINYKEILETGLEILGFDNTDKFFTQSLNTPPQMPSQGGIPIGG